MPEVKPFVTWNYNISYKSSTGFSPYFLVFKQKPRIPFEVAIDPVSHGIDNFEEYIETVLWYANEANQIARESIEKNQAKYKARYDRT